MEPNTQGQDTSPDTTNEGKSGAEKRIDEITAEKYKLTAERDAIANQNQQLTATLAQMMAQVENLNNKSTEPEIEISDDERKKFGAIYGKQLHDMQASMARLEQQIRVQNVNPLAQKYNVPSEVVARAQEIMRVHGVSNEDTAIKLAAGEAAINGKWNSGARESNNNIAARNGLPGGGIPKGNFEPQTGAPAIPPDYANWPPSRQQAWLNKNRPNLHETPF